MHPLLLLWDIDGTLIHSNGAGEESLRQALLNRFGILDDLGDIEISGRTDTAILLDICRKHQGHEIAPQELLEAYLDHLPSLLAQRKGRVCPGVRELLDWAHQHPEIHNALLTGNVQRGAQIKLKHFRLDPFFEFGAFGDDSADRNKLGPIALERSRSRLNKDFHVEFTWVIGDTPRDIACARSLGCKVLAVATGRWSIGHLQAHQPDLLFPTLTDHQAVVAQLYLKMRQQLAA
jgi:phosphoglycolate phosphatase-like HAD superfamily hydrolase